MNTAKEACTTIHETRTGVYKHSAESRRQLEPRKFEILGNFN